ncbi:hypothetical protein [Demequina sediminicola]|uniref:hypothetical protein n=1 Tax=Demequina sediminicola TaxID=1095026 RepID=UPI000781772E|nr:hypothetical protein [Demequina sediminicola]
MTDPRTAAAPGNVTVTRGEADQASNETTLIVSRPFVFWKQQELRKVRAAYVREFYRRATRGTAFSRNPESACESDRRAIARELWEQGLDTALIAEVVGVQERAAA